MVEIAKLDVAASQSLVVRLVAEVGVVAPAILGLIALLLILGRGPPI
jgi:hypothetical protein